MKTKQQAAQTRAVTSVRASQYSFWGNRDLLWALGKRDLQARFKNTVLGWAWSLIVPLAQVAIYSLVFSVIFRAKPPEMGNGEPGIFAVWLFCGIIVWTLFAQALGRGTGSLLAARPLLQKVYFPSYVASFSVVVGLAVQSAIEFSLLLAILALLMNVSWTWLLLPVLFLALLVFGACIGYIFALANLYYRDVSQAVPVILQFGFFLSAIIYPLSLVQEEAYGIPVRTLIELNPMTQFIQTARDLLYELTLPSVASVGYLLAWLLLAMGACSFAYRRWGQDVGEMT
ncbi:MAG: ABC transporter permease [Actinomycetia bacterium]|nr:ABC transporter permease [Actinomycetes bacterium]